MIKYFASVIFLFIVDRLAKIYAVKKTLDNDGGFIDLHINPNIAFSIPLPTVILYPLVIIALFILIYFWLKSLSKKSILIWPWGLLIVGAFSNLLDRFYYQGVVDFINVPFFTVFNLADIYISLAVIWILYYELIFSRSKEVSK
ncbi:signal peptidase II [Candidatus Parcubacteria bacterium]|jgi:signal peptidase II|nr:signal peptidase II [Candidatus Parcubacteria bacterium]